MPSDVVSRAMAIYAAFGAKDARACEDVKSSECGKYTDMLTRHATLS